MQTDPKRGLGRTPNGGLGGRAPQLQGFLTNGLNPYSGFTFQMHLLRSLHVYAISEVNAYTPVLVYYKPDDVSSRLTKRCSKNVLRIHPFLYNQTLLPHCPE